MNKAILQRLKINSRMSWQQIGKEVHLTGQAVAARVLQMEEQGVITGYTIRQDKLQRHFVTVYMESNNFEQFELFLKNEPNVDQAYKVAGEGCYQLVIIVSDQDQLDQFLQLLIRFGKYKIASSIKTVKWYKKSTQNKDF